MFLSKSITQMKQSRCLYQSVQRTALVALFLLFTVITYAQNFMVKGCIKDQAGEPIAGAKDFHCGACNRFACLIFDTAFHHKVLCIGDDCKQ